MYDASGAEPADHPGDSNSSSARCADTVAAAYARHGDGVLERIIGDFAFAVWDASAGRLLLATDPFALRPMYYASHPHEPMVAFSSNTRLLRHLPWIGSELDDGTVIDVLLDRPWKAGHTPFRHIRALGAGWCVDWTAQQQPRVLVPSRYWGSHFPDTHIRSRGALLEAFEHGVRRAVGQRLGENRSTAILMSGGYDSTALAGVSASLAQEASNRHSTVGTVSATFAGLACDESARIVVASTHHGLAGRLVPALGHALSIGSIERQVRDADFPLFNLQDALLNAELDAAREMGAESIMTGIGGDEIAQDLEYSRDLLASLGIRHLFGVARKMAGIHGRSTLAEAQILARGAAPQTVKRAYSAVREVARRNRPEADVSWLRPEWALRSQGSEYEYPGGAPLFASGFQRGRWTDLQSTRAQYGHQATAMEVVGRGFDYVAPFLDRRLFDLVLGTDAAFIPRTSEAGQYKPLIAEGLRGYIPPVLTHGRRWKVEFGSYNVLQVRNLNEHLSEWLSAGDGWKSERYVTHSAALEVATAFQLASQSKSADVYKRLNRLCSIVAVEAWLRQL